MAHFKLHRNVRLFCCLKLTVNKGLQQSILLLISLVTFVKLRFYFKLVNDFDTQLTHN